MAGSRAAMVINRHRANRQLGLAGGRPDQAEGQPGQGQGQGQGRVVLGQASWSFAGSFAKRCWSTPSCGP